MAIEFRILGPLRLTSSDGRDLDSLARQSKRLALLAYLGAAPPHAFHRRDTLLGMFWPELDAARARSALNQALYVLRSALGNEALLTRGDAEVGVGGAIHCDVAAFELALDEGRPADALALYHGDLLEGFFIRDAPEFERWLDTERPRLRHRASDGAWALAESSARDARTMDAIRWSRRAAGLMPDDEVVVRRLMRFLHRLGDRAAAIRAYEAFAWRLGAEYELEPSSETLSLAEAIRDEATHPVSIRLERLLPGPLPRAIHRLGRNSRLRWGAGLGALLFVFAAGARTGIGTVAAPVSPVVRFTVQSTGSRLITSGVVGATIAIAPGNDRIAFLGQSTEGSQLYLRSLDDLRTAAVPHTRGAYLPFFSVDGAWLAFVRDGALRRVKLDGGPAITISEVDGSVFGATWGPNGMIVFATADALWQVPADGGAPSRLAVADTARGVRYRWPAALPGGKAALFTRIDGDGFRLARIALATGVIEISDIDGTHPHFVAPDHIIFARADGALLGYRFDRRTFARTGPVVPLADGIAVGMLGAAKVGVSRAGAFAYVPENVTGRALMLVDRDGRQDTLPLPMQGYSTARFSSDARRIVADVLDPAASARDLWLFDLDQGSTSRLTHDSTSVYPIWSPDGRQIAFGTTSRGREAGFSVRIVTLGNEAPHTVLRLAEHEQVADEFAKDGHSIVLRRTDQRTGRDLWILPLSGDRTPREYLRTPFDERAPVMSPSGHWLAYVSNELGEDEVYVRSFPTPAGPIRISAGGGREPRWSRDGRELFYRSDAGMMAVPIASERGFRAGTPYRLFDDAAFVALPNGSAYDVHPDGNRFLMIRRGTEVREIVVVLNGLERLTSSPR